MAKSTKSESKRTMAVKGYDSDKDLQAAAEVYISDRDGRRGILKRIQATSKDILSAVFHIVPCNWNEVIRADKARIEERNSRHDAVRGFSYVLKK